MSVLDRELVVTVFPNLGAKSKTEHRISLHTFGEHLMRHSGCTAREQLPQFSLCRFGDRLSRKGSLRHRDNILGVQGVVLDYDDGRMPPLLAAKCLRSASIPALLITTPSHTPDHPRWRILVPCGQECGESDYDRLVSRIAGLFPPEVVFDKASWASSQCYYFGALNDRPTPQLFK
jgi:hypothetical protein